MRNLLLLGLAAALTPGCVVYDSSCGYEDEDCVFDNDFDGDFGDDINDDFVDEDGDGIPDEDRDDLSLAFYPATAEQGEVFLASITVAEGSVDLTKVETLHIYGAAEVIVWGSRPGEITATVSIPEDAPPSEVDVVVEFIDGTAELLPAALSIYPAGSGNSAGDWETGRPDRDNGDCE